MKIVNVHEAKSTLSKLIERAIAGEDVIIAKAGTPVVRLIKLETTQPQRLGFLAGQGDVPDHFDTLGGGKLLATPDEVS